MTAPANPPPKSAVATTGGLPLPTALIDLIVVIAVSASVFAVAAALELYETFSRWISPFERYQADELPFALLILAAGLSWYAFRRWREARSELALRIVAEARVSELLRHNRELAHQLISVQESERRALARELHDELGQCCNAIRVEAAFIQRCRPEDNAGIVAAAGRVAGTAESLYQTVRDMLRRLRPANLDELGLVAALQALCESWEGRAGIACVFHSQGTFDRLDDATSVAIYRVAQEALNNVMRHAQAGKVRISLASEDAATVTLAVQDDGIGMQPGQTQHGLGLLGAAERAAALGGTLDISSRPGEGTRLVLVLPLASQAGLADNPGPS
ncbi:MAG TPA: histidine kinase [Rhodocyclaceae bacterium]|nr:histidine kinase [Rhodocyclaceae bacterium]HNA04762.1 histidine kinase [Rhodocyclaceae bacterium]HNB77855.1 histidine kinase [Rhodocyclaceae bacterium]HNH12874.1 histidine kinase [Rhodocyclaceae bacterium]HNH99090.1 histidine kinase [Rhodocyclaceae bacterium]